MHEHHGPNQNNLTGGRDANGFWSDVDGPKSPNPTGNTPRGAQTLELQGLFGLGGSKDKPSPQEEAKHKAVLFVIGELRKKTETAEGLLEMVRQIESNNWALWYENVAMIKEISKLADIEFSQNATILHCRLMIDQLEKDVYKWEKENEELHNKLLSGDTKVVTRSSDQMHKNERSIKDANAEIQRLDGVLNTTSRDQDIIQSDLEVLRRNSSANSTKRDQMRQIAEVLAEAVNSNWDKNKVQIIFKKMWDGITNP